MNIKTLLGSIVLMLGLVFQGFAQETSTYCFIKNDSCFTRTCTFTPCNCADKHPVFNLPTNQQPKKLARLGTFPQFGYLGNYTTLEEVYNHLKGKYEANRNGDAAELDRLFKAIGYSGFNDPAVNTGIMTQISLPCGTTGMLGNGRHEYIYATISEGQNCTLTAYRFKSVNGCDLTIMETCGNGFFSGCAEAKACKTVACGPVPANVRGEDPGSVRYTYFKEGKAYVRKCQRLNNNCAEKHPVYNIPQGKEPKKIARLGSFPQFGYLGNYTTTQEVFDHLKRKYQENRNGDAAELDRLFKAMGYSGFTGPNVTVDKFKAIVLPCGITGMLGDGAHNYEYTEICGNNPGGTLNAYRVKALSGCDLTIMETCGNGFFAGGTELTNCVDAPCGCAE